MHCKCLCPYAYDRVIYKETLMFIQYPEGPVTSSTPTKCLESLNLMNFGTVDTWAWMILHGRGRPVHRGTCGSIPASICIYLLML